MITGFIFLLPENKLQLLKKQQKFKKNKIQPQGNPEQTEEY